MYQQAWALEKQKVLPEKNDDFKVKSCQNVYENPYYQSEDVFNWIMLQISQIWPHLQSQEYVEKSLNFCWLQKFLEKWKLIVVYVVGKQLMIKRNNIIMNARQHLPFQPANYEFWKKKCPKFIYTILD